MRMLVLGCTLFALTAQAEGSLAVVPVFTPPELEALGREVTALLDDEARRVFPSAKTGDAVKQALGEAGYEEARGCQSRPECLRDKLVKLGVSDVVTGSLTRDPSRYHLRLALIRLSPLEVRAKVERTILIASRRLTRDLREVVPRLMRGESEATGSVTVRANVTGARVFVDGVDAGTLPATLRLKPGKRALRVERERHLPVEQWVTVEAGGATTVQLRLLLAPGAAPDDGMPGVQVAQTGAGVWWGRPWPVWLAAGGAVVCAATAAGFALDAAQRSARVRAAYDPGTQTYLLPRTEAVLAQQNARMANTFFLVSGAAAVTAGVLYLLLPAGRAGETTSLGVSTDGSGAALFWRGSL